MTHLLHRLGLAAIAFTALNISAKAQVTTVFYEDFDSPPLNVSTSHTQPGLIQYWNDTNALSVSGTKSYHANVLPQDTIFFQTQPFSTFGNSFVRLSFDHIGKIHFGQRGYIRVSTDNGVTWTTINGNHYRGPSATFATLGYVNELMYANNADPNYWGGATTIGQGVAPTNNWWVNEVFDISSIAGSGPSGTGTGFSQVLVKFALQYRVPSGGATTAGWFVDNLKVEAAPCELIPPRIKWNLNPRREPIGARYQATEQVRLRATDKVLPKSGIDSVVLHYQMNGGTWNMVNMTAVNTSSCPDSSEYYYDFTNLVVGDTINWWVEAFDCACDENSVRSPSTAAAISFNTFWRDPSPPLVCGPMLANSFPFVATSFPYTEDFEAFYWMPGSGPGISGTTHRGVFPLNNPPAGKNYEVTPSPLVAGFGWSVRTGQTGTFGTGPLGDHTTGQGKYLYTEASQGFAGNTSDFITPCLKLDNVNSAAAEFYYHKFGANMDFLRVDIDTGTGFNPGNGVIGALSIPGQTHTSSGDEWDKAFINLTPYLGEYVRLRFVGSKNSSSANDKGDMAIDDIKIFEPFQKDINLLEVLAPENGFCTYSNSEEVQIKFRTEGSQALTAIPFAFSVKNLTTGTVAISRDTLIGTYPIATTQTVTLGPKANLSNFTSYEIYVWSELDGDGQSSNDSIGPIFIDHIQPISFFPYFLNFDGPGWIPGNGTTANPGTFPTTGWFASPSSNSAEFAFMVGANLTSTELTGPRWSKNKKGNYIYAEGNFGANSPSAYFEQEGCVDFTNLTNPVLSFWYHMYGSDISSLKVEVVPSGQNAWVTVPSSVINGQKQSSETSNWEFRMVDLSAYAGQTIKLRIAATKNGAGAKADIAIDEILIYDRPSTDVGVTAITSPPNSVNLASPQNLSFTVRNYGTSNLTNIPVTVVVSDLCSTTSNTYSFTIPTLSSGAEVTQTITTPINYWEGDLSINAYTTLTSDSFSRNDTCFKVTNGGTSMAIPTGTIDFESCAANEYSFFTQGGSGTLQMWEFGTPGKGFNAGSGSNVWMTGLNQNYQGGNNEYLRMPSFVNFDTVMGAEFRFKQRFNFSGSDGGNIEYRFNNVWQALGNSTATVGQNWYGSSYGSSGLSVLGNQPGWTGSTGGQWITSSIPLSFWNLSSNPLNLRFRMGTAIGSSGTGWAIDDVEIYVPPQNSMSPIDIDTKEYLIVPDDTSTLTVLLENTGAKPVDTLQVRYRVNNGPWTAYETVVYNPKMPRGGRRWFEFNQGWLNNGAGSYSICVETHRPNNKQDNLTADDQFCKTFVVSDKITIDATGYCNDFEDPTKAAWLPLHSTLKTAAHDWEFGTPAQSVISSAASGTKAWMTKLSVDYNPMGRSSLHTPFFVLDSNVTYTMKFDHNMFSEQYHDGGSIDWSYNGGINWYTLGNVFPSGKWYNTVHVTSLDNIRPGWSGTTNGWANSSINFTAENQGTLIFRFRFGTDFTLVNEGWAVDNFCLEQAPLGSTIDIIGIGTPEATLTDAFLSGISPNPSQGGPVGMDFQSNEGGSVRLTVYNMLGQPVLAQDFDHQGGLVRLEWETAQLAAGMYNAVVEWQGQSYTRRFVR